ncbi:hypothetical protein BH23CHL7_BH23CHL7_16540 [soil metagenome]
MDAQADSFPPTVLMGRSVVHARAATSGHTSAWSGRVTLDDGRRVFVKAARGDAATPLRREALVLEHLDRLATAPFAARLLEWRDGDPATLVTENLSAAHWPPPYPHDTGPLFEALDQLAVVDPPAGLTPLEEWASDPTPRWTMVAGDPAPFLRLGVCSPAWLERNISALITAESRIDLRGDRLVHNDIYSGNVCFVAERAVLIDWGAAARGNPELDVAFAVLSVMAEGGRLPERELLRDEGAWAARLAGHNAVEAAAPLPGWADPSSTLRQDQLADIRVALPWAARALGLEPPS